MHSFTAPLVPLRQKSPRLAALLRCAAVLGIIGFLVTEQVVFALLWGWGYLYIKKYLYYVIALLTGIFLPLIVLALFLFAAFGANRLLALILLTTGFAALGTAVWMMAVHADERRGWHLPEKSPVAGLYVFDTT